jgi:hypothetical protein
MAIFGTKVKAKMVDGMPIAIEGPQKLIDPDKVNHPKPNFKSYPN